MGIISFFGYCWLERLLLISFVYGGMCIPVLYLTSVCVCVWSHRIMTMIIVILIFIIMKTVIDCQYYSIAVIFSDVWSIKTLPWYFIHESNHLSIINQINYRNCLIFQLVLIQGTFRGNETIFGNTKTFLFCILTKPRSFSDI